jgi:hypothetical protein
MIERTSTTITLAELHFKVYNNIIRTIRLENRSGNTLTGAPSFQLGTAGSPTLSIGDNYARVTNKLWIGAQISQDTTPSDQLTVYGSASILTSVSCGSLTTSGAVSCSSISCSGKVSGYTTFCSGKVNADGSKAFKSASSEVDFTPSSTGTGTYAITFTSAHPAGANYVIQVSGVSCVTAVRTGVSIPSTSFGIVCYNSSGSWTAGNNPFYFTVLY